MFDFRFLCGILLLLDFDNVLGASASKKSREGKEGDQILYKFYQIYFFLVEFVQKLITFNSDKEHCDVRVAKEYPDHACLPTPKVVIIVK